MSLGFRMTCSGVQMSGVWFREGCFLQLGVGLLLQTGLLLDELAFDARHGLLVRRPRVHQLLKRRTGIRGRCRGPTPARAGVGGKRREATSSCVREGNVSSIRCVNYGLNRVFSSMRRLPWPPCSPSARPPAPANERATGASGVGGVGVVPV